VDGLGSRPADVSTDGSDAVEVDRANQKDDSDLPWAGLGILAVVLVAGAFASGWHFGRRWGRLMGW
jgi:hypothetical protein